MLRITNSSVNFEGVISNKEEVEIATISGSVNTDSIYVNMHSYDLQKTKDAKDEIVKDVAEFTDLLLSR